MATCPAMQACRIMSALRACVPPGLIVGQLRTPASPNTSQGLASALLFLMFATASKRSSDTLCCGTWLTAGTKGAGLHSIGTGRHWVQCLVWSKPGKPALVIHSKEGITQGVCFAMSLYGVALMPLAFKMHEAIPKALQPWYCNNASVAGKAMPNAWCLDFHVKFGPP
jgi:hypothetical protein